MQILFSIMLGLVFWLATAAIGLMLAGGGHGWGGPFLISMILIILYPAAFVRGLGPKTGSRDLDAILLGVAGLLDLFLLMNFLGEAEYIGRVWRSGDGPLFIFLWLALWAGWQVLLVISLVRRKPDTPAEGA